MGAKTIILFLGLTAIAFLGVSFINQISPGIIPGGPTPTPSPGALVNASNGCAADPETTVTLKAKLPVDFNTAFNLFPTESTGLGIGVGGEEGGTRETVSTEPSRNFYRIKKNVVISDVKIDGNLSETGGSILEGGFYMVDTVDQTATDVTVRGKPIYWMYGNFEGKPTWMLVLVQKEASETSLSAFGDSSKKYDVYISSDFVSRNGSLPTYIANPTNCGVQTANDTLEPVATVITEENCGNSAVPVTANNAPQLLKPNTAQDPKFKPEGNYNDFVTRNKLYSEYVLVSAGAALFQRESKLIGTYGQATSTNSASFKVYFYEPDGGVIFLVKDNNGEVLMYDVSADALSLNDPRIRNASNLPVDKGGFFLCTVKFTAPANAWSWFTPVCKPAVYLYPTRETMVNVKVVPKGPFTYTDPVYPIDTGWNALASPNGALKYQGKNYDYLYYEARVSSNLVDKPTQGWVVNYSNLPQFYSEILPSLGLNQKEMNQFKEYWEKYLPMKDKYFVGLVSQENIDQIEPLTINPKPDNVIRVRFYFRPAQEGENPVAPTLTSPNRSGFDVMDWGGIVEGVDGFSCVQ